MESSKNCRKRVACGEIIEICLEKMNDSISIKIGGYISDSTKEIFNDIVNRLNLENVEHLKKSLNRVNITYEEYSKRHIYNSIIELIDEAIDSINNRD